MILSNKQENEEVKRQVVELFELEAKFKRIQQQYTIKKEKLSVAIRNFMYCNKGMNDEIEFFAQSGEMFSKENRNVRVRRIVPTTITWDADKLEKRLDKQVAQKIIQKQYTITDMDGLIAYLKSCGVSASKFKSFIAVTKTVDAKALEQLDAVGEIQHSDIKGCYSVKEKSSYLRLDVIEDEN